MTSQSQSFMEVFAAQQNSVPLVKKETDKKRKRKQGGPVYTINAAVWRHNQALHSTIQTIRSSPDSAARYATRKFVKEFPLHEPVIINVKSSAKKYKYVVTRDYDDKNRRSFTMQRAIVIQPTSVKVE